MNCKEQIERIARDLFDRSRKEIRVFFGDTFVEAAKLPDNQIVYSAKSIIRSSDGINAFKTCQACDQEIIEKICEMIEKESNDRESSVPEAEQAEESIAAQSELVSSVAQYSRVINDLGACLENILRVCTKEIV